MICHNHSTSVAGKQAQATGEQTGVPVFQRSLYRHAFGEYQNLLTPGPDQTKAPIQRELHFFFSIKPSQDGRRIHKIFEFLLRCLSS